MFAAGKATPPNRPPIRFAAPSLAGACFGRFTRRDASRYKVHMPAHRKSAAALRLEGTFRGDRHKARANAPEAGGPLPEDAPPHVAPPVAAIWREVARTIPPGLAGAADAAAVEVLVSALWSHREAARTLALEGIFAKGSMGQLVPHPALRIQTAAAATIAHVGAQLGLSPAARLRLADAMPDKPPEADPHDEWAIFGQSSIATWKARQAAANDKPKRRRKAGAAALDA